VQEALLPSRRGVDEVKGKKAAGRSDGSDRDWPLWLVVAIVLVAGLVAYGNSFEGPFVFDGRPTIRDNQSLRQLWPIWRHLLEPLPGSTVEGRPLANLSYALNYAVGGDTEWGYHAVNLGVHLLAGLTLLGVVRRTLKLPVMGPEVRERATALAGAVAAVWTVHPLQTESVTYINQRVESLMGLFFLLTLYCVIRGAAGSRPGRWYAAAVFACLLGMGCKEVMVTAPVVVLLYDRGFLAGTFSRALKVRARLYAGLASTWVVLAWLVIGAGSRGGTAGLGAGMTVWEYLRSQPVMIVRYLRLALWPDPLVFYYGRDPISQPLVIAGAAMVVAALAGLTVWWLRRRPMLGFAGAWFLLILLPSSSVVPIATEIGAEHRIYLSLAAIVAVVVVGGWVLLNRLPGSGVASARRRRRVVFAGAVAVVICALAATTRTRNLDYRTEVALWSATVAEVPESYAAHDNLGHALREENGDLEGALAEFDRALAINPRHAESYNERGHTLVLMGRREEGLRDLNRAIELDPDHWLARYRRGMLLGLLGRYEESVAELTMVIENVPDPAPALDQRGVVLARMGRRQEALADLDRALELQPQLASARAHRAQLVGLGGGGAESAAPVENR
jgi:tetratricopeptide (TPR) repeat protein